MRQQLLDSNRIGLRRRKPDRPGRAVEQPQPDGFGKRLGGRRVLGVDQQPLPAAAVLSQLDVIGEPRRRRLRTSCGSTRCLCQRVASVVGELQARVALAARIQDLRGVLIDRQQPALDFGHAIRRGMLEQCLDQVRGMVSRKAEPPILIGAREVDQYLVAGSLRAAALQTPAEGVRYLELVWHRLEQRAQRVGTVGVERHPPDARLRIPATPRDRTQQQAQMIVVREAEHRLPRCERRDESLRHRNREIRRRNGRDCVSPGG